MITVKNFILDTLHLFYPHVCTGCGSDILDKENLLCLSCTENLPTTSFALQAGNPVEKAFWGRIPVTAAHSQYYFAKESLIQHLIHQLKYKNNKETGIYLGELTGKTLGESNRFNNIDMLVPLPLFPDKERVRGYNQAAVICEGIAHTMQVPVNYGNVGRKRYTETQTRKHRDERWQNVEGSFIVKDPAALKGKNILLVDDVITTGATLEACGSILLECGVAGLFIATLAYADK
ncbi:MAG: ComF family protein [Ferruginibacter sp.]